MKLIRHSQRLRIMGVIILLIIFFGVFFLWLAKSGPSRLKQAILRNLPVPIALVEGQVIYSRELYKRVSITENFFKKSGQQDTKTVKQIYQRLIYEAKLRVLADKKNARLHDWKEFTLPGRPDTSQIVQDALEAQGYESSLKFWYNSQSDLNHTTYALAEQLLTKLNQGQAFGELAKIHSQDRDSLQFEGDLGPIPVNNLMLELREPLIKAALGSAIILPSRTGVHILVPYFKETSENGEDVLYLKQIFFMGNFQEWLAAETKNYEIIILVQI